MPSVSFSAAEFKVLQSCISRIEGEVSAATNGDARKEMLSDLEQLRSLEKKCKRALSARQLKKALDVRYRAV